MYVKTDIYFVFLYLILFYNNHLLFYLAFFFFFGFLGPHAQHMEIPRLGVESEL